MNTIRISVSNTLYQDVQKVASQKGFISIDAFLQDFLQKMTSQKLTENGFTYGFEEAILRSEGEPFVDDVWKTEEDVHRFFVKLKKDIRAEKKNGNH